MVFNWTKKIYKEGLIHSYYGNLSAFKVYVTTAQTIFSFTFVHVLMPWNTAEPVALVLHSIFYFFSELKKLDCMWRRCVMKKTQVDPCVLGRIIIFFVIVCWLHCCVFSIYFFLFHSGCYCVCDVRLVYSQVFCVSLLDKMRWCHSGYEYSLEKKRKNEED